MQSCLFCFPASLRRYRLGTGSTMCPPLCIVSLFATSVVSCMSKMLHQTQHSKIAALAHRWQQIKLVQLEQVLLVPRGDHKDTWLGCSAAPEWLQLMQVELIPTRLSLFLCVVLTLVWCSGREWWKKTLPPSLFNPQPRVGQHPEYVTLTLARAFMFVALPSPPKRGTYPFFFLLRSGLRFFREQAAYENIALCGIASSPEDITFVTVVDLSWQPEVGFTDILRRGLPRRQVQPKIKIQLLRLWENYILWKAWTFPYWFQCCDLLRLED